MEIKLHIEDCSSCGSDNILLFHYNEDVECYCHSCKWSFSGKTEEDAIQVWNLHQGIGKLESENRRLKKRIINTLNYMQELQQEIFDSIETGLDSSALNYMADEIQTKIEELKKDGE